MAGPYDQWPALGQPAAPAAEPAAAPIPAGSPYAQWPSQAAPGPQGGGGSVVDDFAPSLASGVLESVIGVAGLPSLINQKLHQGADAVADFILGAPSPMALEARKASRRFTDATTPDKLVSAVESFTGPFHQPTTQEGKYIKNIAGFIPGTGRNIISGAIVPGIASEAAGQWAKEHLPEWAEPVVRFATGVGSSIGASRVGAPSRSNTIVAKAMEGIDDASVLRAGELIRDAQARGGVVPSWPEALQHVTGGAHPAVANLLRVIEGQPEGAAVTGPFFSQRVNQIAQSGQRELAPISPPIAEPSRVGVPAQQAAREAVIASPEGQALGQAVQAAGPRVTPLQAGEVIQPELLRTQEGMVAARSAVSDPAYAAARRTPPQVPTAAGGMIQVDVRPVIQHITAALDDARGATSRALHAAGELMFRNDGTLDTTVAGLDNARKEIGNLIGVATRNGEDWAATQLNGIRQTLDQALEAVPAYGQARRGHAAMSEPLRPFDMDPTLSKVVDIDRLNDRPLPTATRPAERATTMPAEQVPGALEAPTTARRFDQVATPAARTAMENRIVTQVLDDAGRQGVAVNAETIRAALLKHEDLLNQFPGVRRRLENVIAAREGMAALEQTPIGKIATQNPTIRNTINAIFNPDVGAVEVGNAFREIAQRNRPVAAQVARHYIETIFNTTTQNMKTAGAAEWGGAGFAKALRGDASKSAQLNAALEVLGGPQLVEGFNRYLDIMTSTGQRQHIGSQTAFNAKQLEELAKGTPLAEVAKLAQGGFVRLPARIQEAHQAWSMGSNTDQIARLLIDPTAQEQFRRLAAMSAESKAAQARAIAMSAKALSIASQERDPQKRREGAR